MRRFTILMLAVVVLAGWLGAFACCTLACEETAAGDGNEDANCCATQCLCHSVSLSPSAPATPLAQPRAYACRSADERSHLPPLPADIFHPPRV